MVRIAVTGGIACGKSLVGSFLAESGIPVLDSDDLAHGLIEPDRPAYRDVVAEFGPCILDAVGRIDRRRLGRIVFADAGRRAVLERMLHPVIIGQWGLWLGERAADAAAAVIVPLLYETGASAGWDAVVCVAASETSQRARLGAAGFTEEDIRGRLAAQMPVQRKMELADYVIVNDGTKEEVREQVGSVRKHILEK